MSSSTGSLIPSTSVTRRTGAWALCVYGRRALAAYECRGKPRRSVLIGKGGKLEFDFGSWMVFVFLALAWAWWIMIFQTWGHH